ncbi:hypothetical protein PRIPAC_91485 [Pristionchus pacificus]|nr:hypothetical protein PRIPAC_91485 [Pristionchus pacificus]|eukprot:PDM70205.1 hypothetical protein PRIPAC_45556 [Pristionchus pacificus]
MHPSETLSALVYSDGMDMHPVQSQSLQECSSSQLLTPHSGMEQSKNEMFCKLCGNRFMSMAPLVEHIRREHERDHPKSLAPLNLHTSHLLK